MSPSSVSLNNGSVVRPEDRPRSKCCLVENRNVSVPLVLSKVVARLSNVIVEALIFNSFDVREFKVSTL